MGTAIETPDRQGVATGKPGAHVAPALGESSTVHPWITGLSLLVAALALAATLVGLLTGFGNHHAPVETLRGQIVWLQGGGLYAHDSVSGAAQAIGQDFVTLLVGIPLLLAATYLAVRGSPRGRLLRSGALLYFTYTYLLMAFGGAYNPLFLVYVALYSASLFAFILSLLSIDAVRLRAEMAPRLARRAIGWMLIVFGVLLALLWLGRIVPSLTSGTVPAGLESYGTLFVQAGDLGLIVPLAVLTGVLLLRRSAIGYLLAGAMLVKGAAFGLALVGMIVAMAIAGTAAAPVEVVFFVMLTVALGIAAVHYLTCVPSGAEGWSTGAGETVPAMLG